MNSDCGLKSLDRSIIQKAFEKARDEINIDGARLEIITEEHYDDAVQFAKNYFLQFEPINVGVGMVMDPELTEFWLASFRLNLSLMLVDNNTNEIMAIRTTRIASSDDHIDLNTIKGTPLRKLLEYTTYCDDQADFFGHFGVKNAFHFLGLAVAEKHKKKGLGWKIFQAAINMIKYLGLESVYIKGEGSSDYSKRIYEKSGFTILYEHPFEDWKVNGEVTIQNTSIHKSMKVYGLKVV